MFTPNAYQIAFAPARKPYCIGLLFTYTCENSDFGVISVLEQSCPMLISRVESHILDRSSHSTREHFMLERKTNWEGSIHNSLLPCFNFGSIFAHLFQGAPSELLYCKIRIRDSLKCTFLIDVQFVRHFVLPGKNAVLQPPHENSQIRQTMCDLLFVRFSNTAINDQATVDPLVTVTILKLRV